MCMETKTLLQQARDLIAKGFARETYATADDGTERLPMSASATCFCAYGAICKVLGISFPRFDSAYVNAAEKALYAELPSGSRRRDKARFDCVTDFNDSHTQAEVIELFDRAIAAQP